ncbi:MAG: hypothetical protein WDO13_18305 [Verrucomicrobiota bacterium]
MLLGIFRINKSGADLTDEAKDNLQQVIGPLFASAMGHFETFQKCLFAGAIEVTRLLADWDVKQGLKLIAEKLDASPDRMLAYRGLGAQVGIVFADGLPGWHSPSGVVEYFKCFDRNINFFSNDEIDDLNVLWQLRHTLVHTGGWLTLPDAQKLKRLQGLGSRALRFNEQFMFAFTRLMHRLTRDSVGRLENRLRARLQDGLSSEDRKIFDSLFRCESPAVTYFK